MKKICYIFYIVLLGIALSACGSKEPSPESDPIPEKVEEPATDNPFLLADFSYSGVLSGTGKVIGTYGYIKVEKEQVPDFDTTDFSQYMAEFVNKDVKHSPHNWVSIIFDDGTGFCFAGSNSVAADYGTIDKDGCIVKALGICMLSSDGEFEFTDYGIREIPNPTLMQQGFAPENSFTPAPAEIFSSPASENGLEDSTFYLEGTIVSRFELSGYDTIQLSTEKGDVLISEVFIEFPEFSEGNQITVFFIYSGMSTDYELPCGAYVYHE